jgi:YegS/Rv2252/BmrU family lipid kinase
MRATVILNPKAGRKEANGDLDGAVNVLEGGGWSLSVQRSGFRGEATALARQAAEDGVDAVLVAGGDGTLNEVIQGLAGTGTALGYLPYGTVNIWARELNMPLDPEGAARATLDGRIEQIDLGRANDRYFLLMAGIGLDAEVVRRAQAVERHKQRFGVLPYVAVGLSTVPLYRAGDVELRYDGLIRRVQALMLVVGNTRLYAGRFRLTPQAVANDGWLDLCIVKGKGPISTMRQSFPVLLSGSISRSDVELIRVQNLTVRADTPLPLQVDGELAGTTPVHFSVESKALRVIIPQGFRSSLIA